MTGQAALTIHDDTVRITCTKIKGRASSSSGNTGHGTNCRGLSAKRRRSGGYRNTVKLRSVNRKPYNDIWHVLKVPLQWHDIQPCPSITTQLGSQVLKSKAGHPPAPGTDVTVADVDWPLGATVVAEKKHKVVELVFSWITGAWWIWILGTFTLAW